MTTENQLAYEDILDMISLFQWVPVYGCIRLSIILNSKHPVLETLNKCARAIARSGVDPSEENCPVTDRIISVLGQLLYTGDGEELRKNADQIMTILGIGPKVIGTNNLITTAYALTIRCSTPKRWNDFCVCANRPSWKIELNETVGGMVASINSSSLNQIVPRRQKQQGTSELPETKDPTDKIEAEPNSHRGLATALDDAEFAKAANQLLDFYQMEDTEARHTVISGPESMVNRCSPYNQIIQEKLTSVRYRHGKGKS